MTSEEPIFRSQDISYLGFLESQLRDLGGVESLAFEMIQNADDVADEAGVPGVSRVAFDVTDDALIVDNDGVFRPVDFERLRLLAAGDKRDEAGTTGAFGIGFLAVFQVTDAPQILSAGLSWTIRPEAPPARRIEERPAETQGTRFRLAWATDPGTQVRRALRLRAVAAETLDDIAAQLARAIDEAALFLKRLHTLEVRRNGELLRRVRRQAVGDRLELEDQQGARRRWLLLRGHFDRAADALREEHPWRIEAKRHSTIQLALPLDGIVDNGRLFAVLPLESMAPLPFHLNADFFPTTDRKRAQLESGYQAEWNMAALAGAAAMLARELPALPDRLGATNFWHLAARLSQTHDLAVAGQAPAIFAEFWREVVPRLAGLPAVLTVSQAWAAPGDARRWRPRAGGGLGSLEALGLPLVHASLADFAPVFARPDVGVPPLTAADIVEALQRAGLNRATPLAEAPAGLREPGAWLDLYRAIDDLVGRYPSPADIASFRSCALVLTQGLALERLGDVFRGRPETIDLFPDVPWLHESVPEEGFPGRFVPAFAARQAVEWLQAQPIDRLERAWRMGQLDVPGLLRWLEGRQIEILVDDPSLRAAILGAPLCPVNGELRPLEELWLPGGFEDPLRLASVVDLEAIGGRRQFLHDLGVPELDFDTYLRRGLPQALARGQVAASDGVHRLVAMLAARLAEFRQDEKLRRSLATLPMVACLDGSFRPAGVVFLDREARALLGDEAHLAEPPPSPAVAELLRWLGVRDRPEAPDIVAMLVRTGTPGKGALSPDEAARCRAAWGTLARALETEPGVVATALEPLYGLSVVPDGNDVLRRPDELLLADEPELARRFAGLEAALLPPETPGAAALRRVGVRLLSRAVSVRLQAPSGVRPDPAVAERLAARQPLVIRLVATEGSGGENAALPAAHLDRLEVRRAARLELHPVVEVGGLEHAGEPEAVPAWLDAEESVLYLADSAEPPWGPAATALARNWRIGPGAGLALRSILAEERTSAARRLLDEAGYP